MLVKGATDGMLLIRGFKCNELPKPSYTGDPLHNQSELDTTKQRTAELHTAQRLGGVLARLCAICPDSSVGWPNVGPTSVRFVVSAYVILDI